MMAAVISVPPVLAVGETSCQGTTQNPQAGEIASSGSYLVGDRATIEGQTLPLCVFTGSTYPSGSFHWASLENLKPAWDIGVDIVQIGYGHCLNTNNGAGLGTLCNGSYYYYWAWGSYCGGTIDGTLPGVGPVGIRIGAALTNPPATNDYYVVRETVNGTVYYDGYVNGSLLTGANALGQTVSARVPASQVCWDSDQADRRLAWFGETFNYADSMGGWSGSTKNHLDYNPLRYSKGSGWVAPSLSAGSSCNAQTAPVFTCTIAASDHIYIDTTR